MNPVALGRVRAKQDRFGDRERKRGLAVLVHGDAAFIGEGIVQETLNLSQLPGYRVGGTLHVVANNQLGFTTLPSEYTSSRYPTDVAKMVGAPIFHVNAEALDELLFVLALALEYRSRYGKDVVIDLVGYRRRGHNETDEPTFTQPGMYALIAKKPEPWRVYAERLEAEGLVSEEELKAWQEAYLERLESEFARVKAEATPVVYSTLGGVWQGYVGGPDHLVPEADTAFPKEGLKNLLVRLSSVPEGFQVHPKLKRFLEARREMAEEKRPVDWATAEALAFATLAVEGHRVRLTGQDALRGTFTQRHAALYDYRTGERYIPLQHLAEGQAEVEIHNSPSPRPGSWGLSTATAWTTPRASSSGRPSSGTSSTWPRSTLTSSWRAPRSSGTASRASSSSCPTGWKARAPSTPRRGWSASCSSPPRTTSRWPTPPPPPSSSTSSAAR